MKILQVHNFYQQAGGEDQVFAAEHELLVRYGHTVEQFSLHNDDVRGMGSAELARKTVWNSQAQNLVTEVLRRFEPDLIHCHNTFPLISPAVYYAASAARVPVVQTLHNYRLVCPAATLYRDGHVCEDCLRRRFAFPAVQHRCYRGSRLASLAVASMLGLHRIARTWATRVDSYIALTEFARARVIEGGLPGEKIFVKPNFVSGELAAGSGSGSYALFAGRLTAEKGLRTLLAAWRELPDTPLRIAGDGPQRAYVEAAARELPNVSYLGAIDHATLLGEMRAAACLVVPSEWYEGFPMVVVEAMACGTPIVASDLGSLRELVVKDVTGLCFTPADAGQLTAAVRALLADSPRLALLRINARRHYEHYYTPGANYVRLASIYQQTVRNYRYSKLISLHI